MLSIVHWLLFEHVHKHFVVHLFDQKQAKIKILVALIRIGIKRDSDCDIVALFAGNPGGDIVRRKGVFVFNLKKM